MEKLSIAYFRNLVDNNVKALKACCSEWQEASLDPSVPEEVRDEIRSTIGLTTLLLHQKLSQFSGLIDDSELKIGEKEVTLQDLQGFWDMVYNEVEKIIKSFKKLENCKNNSWVYANEVSSELEIKKKPKTLHSTAKLVATSKSHAIAARQRLADAKLKMKAQMSKKQTVPYNKISGSSNRVEERELQDSTEEPISSQQEAFEILKDSENVEVSPVKEDLILPKSKTSVKKSSETTAKVSQKRQIKNGKENSSTQKEREVKPQSQAKSANLQPGKSASGGKEGTKPDFIPLQVTTRSASKLLLVEESLKK